MKYDEIMDKIVVTDEMRKRILDNVASQKPQSVVRFPHMKRYLSIAACFAVLAVVALTVPKITNIAHPDEPDVMAPANGIVEVSSVDELSSAVGFEVSDVANLPFTPSQTVYSSYWGDMAQIDYSGEGQSASFRKSVGTEDISGDYNTYASTVETAVGTADVTLKGDNDLYTLAVWTDNGYSYSLYLSEGITEDRWETIINGIN